MTRLEALKIATDLRAARSSHDVARGLDYTVGLSLACGADDHYVITIAPFR